MRWRNLITVEPAMFLQKAGDTLTYVIFQNLFIEKICKYQLNYDKNTCQLYEEVQGEIPKSKEFLRPIVNNIQVSSSSFVLYNSLVENSLPVFLVLFLGVWSDATRRRKPSLLISLTGKLFRSMGLLLNAYFMAWHPYVLLFTVSLPNSLGGGDAVFHMAAFSYLSDASASKSRTWRMGIAEMFWVLGTPTGLYLGSLLFESGGYLAVFGTATTFHLIAVIYSALVLPEVPQQSGSSNIIVNGKYYLTSSSATRTRSFSGNEKALQESLFNNNDEKRPLLEHNFTSMSSIAPSIAPSLPPSFTEKKSLGVWEFLIGTVKTVLKNRPNHIRKCLLALGVILMMSGTGANGESSIKYLYTRNRFLWREAQFSIWAIVEGAVAVFGLLLVMPLFSRVFKFSDPFSGAIGSLLRATSKLYFAFGPNSESMYIALGFDLPGVMGSLSARSLASKCVHQDERGKVFAFIGCLEALVPLFAIPLYSMIYSSTLQTTPTAVFFLSASIYSTNFLIFMSLFICSKLKIINFSGNETSASLTEKGNGDNVEPTDKELGLPASYMYKRSSLP